MYEGEIYICLLKTSHNETPQTLHLISNRTLTTFNGVIYFHFPIKLMGYHAYRTTNK